MSEPWFRMHANIGDKPVAWRLAAAAHISLAKAVGHLAMFWGKVSQFADGGQVEHLSDQQLEAWAAWDGKRGAFAAWVRADHLTDGHVNEYEEYSGPLDVRREKDRIRKAAQRDRARTSRGRHADSPQDVTQDVPRDVTRSSRRTIRNDTKRDKQQTATTPASGDAAPQTTGATPPKYPSFPVDVCGRLYDAWVKQRGAVEYSAFRKALAPLYPAAGPLYAEQELADAITVSGEYVMELEDRDARFETIHSFAQRIGEWVRLGKLPLAEDGVLTERGAHVGTKSLRRQRQAGAR